MKLMFLISVLFLASLESDGQPGNLAYYLQAGIENSPFLYDLRNQQLSGLIDSSRIKAGYLPQVSGVSYNLYAPVIKGYGYDEVITNGVNINQLVVVSKQMVGKENLQNQFLGIRLQNNQLQLTGKITEQDLRLSITDQYINAYGSLRELNFNREVYDLLAKEEIILKKLTQGAVYRQTDYLTFLVTYQQQEIVVSQAKIQYQNDYAALNYLCGLTDTSQADGLKEPDIELQDLSRPENTLYYQKYLIDSLVLQNNAARIDFSYKPRLSFFADAGYISTLSYLPYKNFGASIGVSLNVPIYDGRQKKMLHEKISIEEQSRQHYRDFFRIRHSQQVALLLQQLRATESILEETDKQIRYSQGLIEANSKLLATGDVRIADYVLAINNYLNARNLITKSLISKLKLINQINYWNQK